VGTTVLFVPETAVEAFATGSGAEWGTLLDLAPLMLVSAASALDAYQLAVLNNYLIHAREHTEGTTRSCPECGRPLDDDLTFCHWCSTRLTETADGVESAGDDSDSDDDGDGDGERYPLE
jgi:endogenous inhibitor of DNA gyrase (YacG/DUF329 family)